MPTIASSHHAYGGLVRFSISIPQRDADGFDEAGFKRYLTRAEELGFEGGWTLEQVIGPSPLIAPMELLAYAAACTTRLRLGVAVLITSLHDRCNWRRRSPPSTGSATAGSTSGWHPAAAFASSRRSAWRSPRSSAASPKDL